MIVDESSVRSDCEVNGTVRWMAPELFFPEHFGFTNVDLRRLPSQSTDVYAIGMTIFEVRACVYQMKSRTYPLAGFDGMSPI